jgi:sialate O-acetylesterase
MPQKKSRLKPFMMSMTFSFLFSLNFISATVKPAGLFVDNMVIQRNSEVPIWGKAEPKEKVTVNGSWGERATVTTGADGKWMVKLKSPAAGGPYVLNIKGSNEISIKNVLSGDVWLCSGQSNMAFTMGGALNGREDAKKADYPNIRHFAVPTCSSSQIQEDLESKWVVCSPATVKSFTALGYYAGQKLHEELNVPIGLINSSVGGTDIVAWTPLKMQKGDLVAERFKSIMEERAEHYNAEKAEQKYDKEMADYDQKLKIARSTSERLPRKPRMQINPIETAQYPGSLYNGMIAPLQPYTIKGVMWYQGEANTKSIAYSEHYRVNLDRMIRVWREEWRESFSFYFVQLPDFKKAQVNAVEHQGLWAAIRDSFFYVRHHTPNVGMAVGLGLGNAKNIHPKRKKELGLRMASEILNITYHKKTPTSPLYTSFTIEGNKVIIHFDHTGSGLITLNGKELQCFAIAGLDKTFSWAEASIEKRDGKDVIVVSSAEVTSPTAVRYAWADNPERANLYNKEGMPASPFRTDHWDLTK